MRLRFLALLLVPFLMPAAALAQRVDALQSLDQTGGQASDQNVDQAGGDQPPAETAPTISAVRVEGVQRIEPNTVLSYITLRGGDQLTDEKIDQAIKALYATGFFSDVALMLDGDVLVIKVEENPIINRIGFEGNDEIKTEDLEKEVQLKPRTVFTRARTQTDVDRVLTLYRRSGRYAATVEPKIVKLEQNRVDLVFEISEGAQTGIERIQFVGNKAFGADDLRQVLATRETRWWRVFSTSDYYDADRINFDRELLRRFYLNHGYADFRVLSAVAELAPDKKDFFVNFTVEEGDRYKLGKVELTSNIKNFDPETLRDQVVGVEGDWYDASNLEKTITNLTNAVGDLQYAFVDIQPDIKRNRETHTIDITYRINEGQRVFIHQVNIKGNTRTLDEVIRRELLLAEGDPYNASKIKQSEQRLKDLNFFDNVKIDVAKVENDQSDLNVSMTEKSTGEVSVGAGYSTNDGILGDFTIRERNFLGRGQNVKLSATLSQRTQQYDFSFTEPNFLDRDLAAGFDLFRVTTDNQSSSSYDQDNTGFDLRMGYPLGDKLRQKLTYTLQQTDIRNVPINASRFIREQSGNSITSSVGQELSYDSRDSKLTPTKGYILRLSNDFAGLGGDISYLRTRTGGSVYFPVTDDVVFNVDGEVGYIFGTEGKDVRISDRFFLGGDTLRGFEFGGIGPRDLTPGGQNDALGGNEFARASAEFAFPIGLPDELGIKGHAFSDAGTLYGLDIKANPGEDIRNDHSIRVSAGLGISWQSPFGPIRVDYAVPVKQESYDDDERFRFSFGTSF